MEEYLDLLQLQQLLKEGLEEMFPERVWVKAELASVQVKANGHCYLELCQGGNRGVVAKARAVIWRNTYNMLSAYFRKVAGDDLKAGMSLLLQVQLSYSEIYGLSLVVCDIDASYTVGEAERKRRETIDKLAADGLMDVQKNLQLPRLPYRLAVISASDAAGYGDFRRHLLENEYGFCFDVKLFPATMQGDAAPESIASALEMVECSPDKYDAVLIMRGGGSVLDLACFDDYSLCFAIANCGIPVLTAIGHDRDYHVADMVAHDFVKTPTALADLFLDCYIAEDERLSSYASRLRLAFSNRIALMNQRIASIAARISAADPTRLLQNGYAIVAGQGGSILKSSADISEGDRIELRFSDGIIDCEVKGKRQK